MKARSVMLAAACLLPALVSAQVTPPAINTKAVFAIMQRNVASIKQPAERDRWNANVAMWQVALTAGNQLSTAELGLLKASIETMKTNVSQITPAGEEQRWLANVTLWQAYIDGHRTLNAKAEPIASTFEKMKKNIARLNDSPEKERWQANVDLWQALLTPQP